MKASLEVYPLDHYGTVEIGVHRFYETPAGQPEPWTGIAKFVHIWREANGT